MTDRIGTDFAANGSVLSTQQLQEQRRKKGLCLTCGQKCFNKKIFKSIPITIHGQVLNGRCLKCNPLEVKNDKQVLPATSRPATREDIQRFSRTQSSLRLNPQPPRRTGSRDPTLTRGPSLVSIGEQAAANTNQANSRTSAPTRHSSINGDSSSPAGGGTYNSADESQSVRSGRSSRSAATDSRMRVRRAGGSDSNSSRSERTYGGGIPGAPPQPLHANTNSGLSSSSNVVITQQQPQQGVSRNNSRIRRGESSRSIDSSISGGASGGNVRVALAESSSHTSGRQLSSGRSSPSPASRQSPMPEDHHQYADDEGGDEGVSNDEDDEAGVDIHQAVLGGMAAHYLAERFRSRKAAQRAQQEQEQQQHAASLPPESAPETLEMPLDNPFGVPDRIGMDSAHSTDSWNTGDDDEMLDGGPTHGVLNRGGAFPGPDEGDKQTPPFAGVHAESSRTMSSMSSIEEEPNNAHHNGIGHQKSWKPNAPAVFEDDGENSNADGPSRNGVERRPSGRSQTSGQQSSRSSRSGAKRRSSVNQQFQNREKKALEDIEAARGSYEAILGIMGGIPSSAVVQQEGLKDLSNLHLSDHDHTNLADIGALERIVEAMDAHPHSGEVQLCGCRAVWNLSATTQNQVRLVDAGALDALVLAMESFSDDSELQEKAMAALSNLGAAEDNQASILERGTLEKIVEAMTAHSENGAVQSKACSAITNFASYDSPLKQKIMECGGGGAVVISMIMHPDDVDLQEKALRALRNICANSDANKVEVAKVGGIDAVISAMQVHRDEPGVQEAGAWTLSNLAVNPDNKAVIGDSGGIDVVVRAMWVHSDNVGVQEWCCRALWTLSVDAQNRQVMLEVGGISAVVNAMQAHADAATVQEKGCGVLSNLAASDDECKMRIVEEEALDAIIMAMVLHADNAQVQDRACSVVKRLAIPANVKAMQAANVGELVREAGRKFPKRCKEKARAIMAAL